MYDMTRASHEVTVLIFKNNSDLNTIANTQVFTCVIKWKTNATYAILQSGKMLGRIEFKLSANGSGILFSASSIEIFEQVFLTHTLASIKCSRYVI